MSQTRWQRRAPDVWWKQGDTAPALAYQFLDGDGNAVDITGASVRLITWCPGTSSAKINASATITSPSTGVVTYSPIASDTNTIGDMIAEFEVTFAGGAIETWPDGDWLKIRILDDLA